MDGCVAYGWVFNFVYLLGRFTQSLQESISKQVHNTINGIPHICQINIYLKI